jgi:hypothetical protein
MPEGNRERKRRLEKELALGLLAEKRLVMTERSVGAFDAVVRVDEHPDVSQKYRVSPETRDALIEAGVPIEEATDA